MSPNLTRRSALKLLGSTVVALSANSGLAVATRSDLRQAARKHVANETDASIHNLAVVAETTASWTTLGEQYYNAKVRNVETRSLHAALLDADGDPVNRNALNRREEAAYRDRYGKLDRRFADKTASLEPDDRVTVTVWLESVDHDAAKAAVDLHSRPNTADAKRALADFVGERVASRASAFADRVRGNGVKVLESGLVTPTVDLRLPVAALDSVQAHDDVWRVLDRDVERVEHLDSASDTHGTYDGWSVNYDCSGYVTGHIEFDHPYDSASSTSPASAGKIAAPATPQSPSKPRRRTTPVSPAPRTTPMFTLLTPSSTSSRTVCSGSATRTSASSTPASALAATTAR
jgi:hypothetical protein